jgi:ATP-dependent RNA helicase DeaD
VRANEVPEAPVAVERDAEPPPEPSDAAFAQIFVNVGRRDGARAEDFQKLLEEGGGIPHAETGQIRVRDRMTFVSVRREHLDRAIAAFSGQVIGGRNVVAELARTR